MPTEDQTTPVEQPKPVKSERFISGPEWLVLSVLALASSLPALRSGGPALAASFIGRIVAFAVIWIAVRGIYRWIKRKRSVA